MRKYLDGDVIGPVKVLGYIPEDKKAEKRGSSKYILECLGCGSVTNKSTGDLAKYASGILKHGCVTCGRESLRTDGRGTVISNLYHNYKAGAEKRSLPFELTKTEFRDIVSQVCLYCGSEGTERRASKNWYKVILNGVDRLDNSLGYTVENSVPCCSTCNFAKRAMTTEQFFAWVRQIASYEPWNRV